MGSSESRDELLQIHITIDKAFYYAGDMCKALFMSTALLIVPTRSKNFCFKVTNKSKCHRARHRGHREKEDNNDLLAQLQKQLQFRNEDDTIPRWYSARSIQLSVFDCSTCELAFQRLI